MKKPIAVVEKVLHRLAKTTGPAARRAKSALRELKELRAIQAERRMMLLTGDLEGFLNSVLGPI